MSKVTWLALAAMVTLATPGAAQQFHDPVRLEAGGQPITTDIGHAAPYVYDFDGDGVRDLLVGQFGQGKLRIYRNTGTNDRPRYAAHHRRSASTQKRFCVACSANRTTRSRPCERLARSEISRPTIRLARSCAQAIERTDTESQNVSTKKSRIIR